jgi:hypothetical protein
MQTPRDPCAAPLDFFQNSRTFVAVTQRDRVLTRRLIARPAAESKLLSPRNTKLLPRLIGESWKPDVLATGVPKLPELTVEPLELDPNIIEAELTPKVPILTEAILTEVPELAVDAELTVDPHLTKLTKLPVDPLLSELSELTELPVDPLLTELSELSELTADALELAHLPADAIDPGKLATDPAASAEVATDRRVDADATVHAAASSVPDEAGDAHSASTRGAAGVPARIPRIGIDCSRWDEGGQAPIAAKPTVGWLGLERACEREESRQTQSTGQPGELPGKCSPHDAQPCVGGASLADPTRRREG